MPRGLDELPAGVLVLSADLRIRSINRTLLALSDRASDELIGEPFDALLSAPSRILFQSHVYPALRTNGRVEEAFLSLAPRDGESVPVLFNASWSEASEAYHCAVVRVLARTAWEQELLRATKAIAEEQAASRRLTDELATTAAELAEQHAVERKEREFRDALIGVISHELRTPITTIFGMSHILRERFAQLPAESVREHLADIHEESDRLRRLVDDLLVLGRTEHGQLDVSVEPIDAARAILPVVRAERDRAPGFELAVEIEPGLPPVMGEDVLVGQILRNYLSNAVKYTPPETTIRVAARAADGGVAITVTDAGPGLRTDTPDQLFELFYRTSDAVRRASGAGIGLFVCREIAAALGGRTWARDAPGGGAEFGLWLPPAEGSDDD